MRCGNRGRPERVDRSTLSILQAMTVGFRSLLFTLFIPGSATVWIPWLILAQQAPGVVSVPYRLAGGLLIAASGVLYFSCLWNFTSIGRGTPAVWDPPVVFVSRGPYRFVRNPMYLAIAGVLAGEALCFGFSTLGWMATVFAAGSHLFVVLYEEPALKRKFGASYERYCSEVSRWLPRWPHR